jgi:hypothetical protein
MVKYGIPGDPDEDDEEDDEWEDDPPWDERSTVVL